MYLFESTAFSGVSITLSFSDSAVVSHFLFCADVGSSISEICDCSRDDRLLISHNTVWYVYVHTCETRKQNTQTQRVYKDLFGTCFQLPSELRLKTSHEC